MFSLFYGPDIIIQFVVFHLFLISLTPWLFSSVAIWSVTVSMGRKAYWHLTLIWKQIYVHFKQNRCCLVVSMQLRTTRGYVHVGNILKGKMRYVLCVYNSILYRYLGIHKIIDNYSNFVLYKAKSCTTIYSSIWLSTLTWWRTVIRQAL